MLLSIMDGSFRRFIGVSILILFLNKNLEGASSNELRSKNITSTKVYFSSSLWDTLKKHYELIFAIASGIFILAGWLFTKNDVINVGITCYILAYIVGGYAKAKEGIEDTIEEKELNVRNAYALCCYRCCNHWLLGRRRNFNLYLRTKRCNGILYIK